MPKSPFEELSSDIWSRVIDRLMGISTPDPRQHHCYRFAASLLSSFTSQSRVLPCIRTILAESQTQHCILLDRGTAQRFSSSTVHTKCDDHSNPITFLTTKGSRFGGLTPVASVHIDLYATSVVARISIVLKCP
jgi:hypothetical protein